MTPFAIALYAILALMVAAFMACMATTRYRSPLWWQFLICLCLVGYVGGFFYLLMT
jgi:nitrate/nitrite transporter NarK